MRNAPEMKQMRMGVLGCSEFAGRALVPAIMATPGMQLVAVASRELPKAKTFAERFGCDAVEGYEELLQRADIEAVYVPLPPGLHEEWVERSLLAGKHVLVEKPFVLTEVAARRLIGIARVRNLAIVEDMLFPHHSQTRWVQEQLAAGLVGDVRLFRCTFSIPALKDENFRYAADQGGGVLLDMGPYMIRFATLFLDPDCKLLAAALRDNPKRGVDTFATAQFVNPRGQMAQAACGFDTYYQCFWEFLGNTGRLIVERGFTPPPGHAPVVHVDRQGQRQSITLPADNHYQKMCSHFLHAVSDQSAREAEYERLAVSMKFIEQIRSGAVRL